MTTARTAAEEDADGILLLQHDTLGTDLSYLCLDDYSHEQYEVSLQGKVQALRELFQPYWSSVLTVFRSPPVHHRLRAKFGIGRVITRNEGSQEKGNEEEEKEEEEGLEKISEGTAANTMTSSKLCYLMWGYDQRPVAISSFPLASRRINDLMPRLLQALEAGPVVLRRGLRAVNFLDTLAGDTLISLMYQVPLIEGGKEGGQGGFWAEAAGIWLRDGLGCQVVGRSKGRVVAVDRAYVTEAFHLFPCSSSSSSPCFSSFYLGNNCEGKGDKARKAEALVSFFPPPSSSPHPSPCSHIPVPTILRYKQWEGAFSNPNGQMAMHTIRWLCARADAILLAADEAKTEADEEGGNRAHEGLGGCGESKTGSDKGRTNSRLSSESSSSSSYKSRQNCNHHSTKSTCDLLELYCGGGNHTVALSRKFQRVVGVEIDKRLVAVARENLVLNGIENTTIIQIPSEKFRVEELGKYRRKEREKERKAAAAVVPGEVEGMKVGDCGNSKQVEEEEEGREMEEEGRREEDDEFNFGVVLVDPPRVGLDRHTRKLISQYEHILYISCGPHSMLRDLQGEDEEKQERSTDKTYRSLAGFGLVETHDVVDMCVLDHFPGTMHIEAAVHLRRRRRRYTSQTSK